MQGPGQHGVLQSHEESPEYELAARLGEENAPANITSKDYEIGRLLLKTTDALEKDNGRLRVINHQCNTKCERQGAF